MPGRSWARTHDRLLMRTWRVSLSPSLPWEEFLFLKCGRATFSPLPSGSLALRISSETTEGGWTTSWILGSWPISSPRRVSTWTLAQHLRKEAKPTQGTRCPEITLSRWKPQVTKKWQRYWGGMCNPPMRGNKILVGPLIKTNKHAGMFFVQVTRASQGQFHI